MNRRGFLSSLAALATTAALPSLPSIPVMSSVNFIHKVMLNSMYGKFGQSYMDGRVVYADTDGIFTVQDICSAYPKSLTG